MIERVNKVGLQDKRYKVTNSQKQQIIAMRNSGMTYNAIAEETGFSRTTIIRVINPQYAESVRTARVGKKQSEIRYKDKERRKLYMREYCRGYYHEKVKPKKQKEEK
jgi:hypothetical protein